METVTWFKCTIVRVTRYTYTEAANNFSFLIQLTKGKLQGWINNIHMDLTFLVGPEWIIAALFYLAFSYIQQKTKNNVQLIAEGGLS